MPEFEDAKENTSPGVSYTPSSDAEKKPRTRRRSGGFKTEVQSMTNANIGEVDPTNALKHEKLSGRPSNTDESKPDRSERPRRERSRDRKDGDTPKRESKRPERELSDRPVADPKPSEATLAAIAKVEERLEKRKAEKEARRATRGDNRNRERRGDSPKKRSEQPKGGSGQDRKKRSGGQTHSQNARSDMRYAESDTIQPQSSGGIFGAIKRLLSGIFGSKESETRSPQVKSTSQGNRARSNNRGSSANRQRGGHGNNRSKGPRSNRGNDNSSH